MEGKIALPARSMRLERAKELACWCPGVREDMVADLRARILEGAYEATPERVAEKIMRDGICMLGRPERNGPHTCRGVAYD